MEKDMMIKLRIEKEKVEWLKQQPEGMSATIRSLIANAMSCDDLVKRWRKEDDNKNA